MLSLEQIKLIYQNAPTLSLSKYTSRSKFFPFFLTHLQKFFELKSKKLYLSEPLLEDDEQSQVVSILVDGEAFGQLYYLIDDYTLEATLFFYSEEFSHKYFLLENEMVEETAIHTYYFWLGALYGIYNSYQEDKQSRKN